MKQVDVSKGTAVKARRELQESGEIKQQERKPKQEVKKTHKPNKKEQATQAAEEFVEWAVDLTSQSKTPLTTLVTWFDNINLKHAKKLLAQQLKRE
jgi:hypothetical protein